MMGPGREIKVVISSPSDAVKERDGLLNRLETIFRRALYEELCGARIIVEGWEGLAAQPGNPQEIINSKLIKEADIVVVVFRHRLGTPTIDPIGGEVKAPSGTAEELLQALEPGKRPIGMTYFFETPPLDQAEATQDEWKRLEEFKKSISPKVIYKLYKDEEKLLDTVCRDLCQNIRDHLID